MLSAAPPAAPPPTSRPWRLPLLMALLTVGLRLAVILAFADTRDDLRIYTYYGGLMAHGLNPYSPPANAPVGPQYANIAPFNLGLFAAVLALWDSPTALRLLFALVDGAIVLTIGCAVRRPRAWRSAVMDFYTFNPLVLLALVVDAQDKVVVIWLLILIVTAIEAQRAAPALIWTTVLTLYRWLGAFFVLPVAIYFARTWRSLLLYLGLFGLAFAFAHIPYWPANLFVYTSRAARTLINPPIHDSPTMLLAAVGLYSPRLVPVMIATTLAVLYTLFALRRTTLVEVVILSTFFTTMAAPELPASRIVMVSLPLLWLIRLSRRRLLALWVVTSVAGFFVHPDLATNLLRALGVPLAVAFPSVPHTLLINALPALLLAYYAVDKRRGHVASDTLLPAAALRIFGVQDQRGAATADA